MPHTQLRRCKMSLFAYHNQSRWNKGSYWKENISIVFCFVNAKTLEITERLLVMATAGSGDAQPITNIILSELAKADLSPTDILSQVYNGWSWKAWRCPVAYARQTWPWGAACPLPEPTVAFCCCTRVVISKPTDVIHYWDEKLKCLLDQRWTVGWIVAVILGSIEYWLIKLLLAHIDEGMKMDSPHSGSRLQQVPLPHLLPFQQNADAM